MSGTDGEFREIRSTWLKPHSPSLLLNDTGQILVPRVFRVWLLLEWWVAHPAARRDPEQFCHDVLAQRVQRTPRFTATSPYAEQVSSTLYSQDSQGLEGRQRGKVGVFKRGLILVQATQIRISFSGKTGKELPGRGIQLYTLPLQELYWRVDRSVEGQMLPAPEISAKYTWTSTSPSPDARVHPSRLLPQLRVEVNLGPVV